MVIKIEKIKKRFEKVDKKALAIVGLVILVIVALAIIICNANAKDKLLELIYDPKKPILIEKNGRYGYVDIGGEELIEPTYKSATPFYGDYALVELADEENSYRFLDRKGQTIEEFVSSKMPRYFREYGIWLANNILYDYRMNTLFEGDNLVEYIADGYFAYFSNNEEKSGIIDYKGKIVFTWDANYISVAISPLVYAGLDKYAAISNFEEREEIVNLQSGKVIYSLEDPKNSYLEVENDNIFRVIDRQDSYKTVKWLYIEDDKIAFETSEEIYDMTNCDYKDDILKLDYGVNYSLLGKEERYAYYDVRKKEYKEKSFTKASVTNRLDSIEEDYGYKTYTCDGLYGLLNRDKVIIDCQNTDIIFPEKTLYDYLEQYHKQKYVIIRDNARLVIYDLKHRKEVESYDVASLEKNEYTSFLSIVELAEDGFTKLSKSIFSTMTGQKKDFPPDAEIVLFENYILVKTGEKMTYYDVSFEVIYEMTE